MGVLRGQILRHQSQNCLVLVDDFWGLKMRFVSLIQQFASPIYRSTVLRKAIRFTLKVAATTVVAILTILTSLVSIWSAALATQNADGPKVLEEIPKQLFLPKKSSATHKRRRIWPWDKYPAEEPPSLN